VNRELSYDEQESILRRIKDYYDPDWLVDTLGLDCDDIVEAFRERILNSLHLFELGEEEEQFDD
jgi:hypothetical protein